MNINLKQMDALEFVNSLEGGWDTIIWDPPYLSLEEAKKYQVEDERNCNIINKQIYKTYLGEEERLRIQWLSQFKARYPFVFVDFYKHPKSDATRTIIWNKEPSRSKTGDKYNILNNVEYLNFFFYGTRLLNHISKVVSIPKITNQFSSFTTYYKPVKLYIKIFEYLGCNYVLDPFAGSYNSTKACKKLGIRIDSCDKYLKPPDIIGLEKWIE